MKTNSLVIVVTSGILLFCTNNSNNVTYDPSLDGYVPNKETAIKIAEAIWLPIFGKEIYDHTPFKATLKGNGIWVVEGTLHSELGGVPYIEIQKKDCKILDVYHSK